MVSSLLLITSQILKQNNVWQKKNYINQENVTEQQCDLLCSRRSITLLFCCNTDFFKFYSIFLLSSSYVSCWSMNGNSTAPLSLGEFTLSVRNRLAFENNYLPPSYWLKSVTLAVDGSHSWLVFSAGWTQEGVSYHKMLICSQCRGLSE